MMVPSPPRAAGALNDSPVGITGAQYQRGLSLGGLLVLIWEVWIQKLEDELLGIESMGRVPPPLVASPSILGDEVPILLHLLTCEGGTPFVGLLFDVGGESPHSISGSVGI